MLPPVPVKSQGPLSSSSPSSFLRLLLHIRSERQARASSGDSAAEPEAAGLSQQGGATPTPEIHGHRSQTAGGQIAQRGEGFLCVSCFSCVLADVCSISANFQ